MTDTHLDHLKEKHARFFLRQLATTKPDAVVSCGDMSEATELSVHLGWVREILDGIPFYFVNGNHDYYRGSIAGVRQSLASYSDPAGSLVYLTHSPPVQLAPNIMLVGHDGWYDGRLGDWFKSRIIMTDYAAIAEFRHQSRAMTKLLMEDLANHSANKIAATPVTSKRVIIATHVPPFRECSRGPDRNESDADWLPVMSSKIMGDVILRLGREHPATEFTVLCGHTHTPWKARVAPNVECIVGDADATGKSGYGHPMWTMLEIDNDALPRAT